MLVLIVAILFNYFQISKQYGCTISTNKDIAEPQPLILKPKNAHGNDAFYYPNKGDEIHLRKNKIIHLACPGSNLTLNGIPTGKETGCPRCRYGNFFFGEQILDFNKITCSKKPKHTARYTGKECGESKDRQIEIGFRLGKRFLRQILVCFDERNHNVVYTEYNLTKSIRGYQRGQPRPGWIQGSFYNLSGNKVDNLYRRDAQRTTINKLLGLDHDSFKYVSESGDFYLARGHLVAKTDFVYGAQQRLTFYFLNAAPQWQIFNKGNWKSLEFDVRAFASQKRSDFTVYTGTFGVASLPHETTAENVELYLYVNGTDRSIPVPRLFWKVLYNPRTSEGYAFVGINNPYVFDRKTDVICKNTCRKYKWLTWKPSNVKLGYSYCCDLKEFTEKVTVLRGLLKEYNCCNDFNIKLIYLLFFVYVSTT